MNTNNNKLKNLTSQQENQQNLLPDADFSENPIAFFEKEKEYIQDVLEVILSLSDHFLIVMPSHEYIAIKSGVCISLVQRALKFFKEHGILTWKRRFNSSNIYKVASCFFDFNFRSKLSHLFQWLKYVPFVLLLFLPEDIIAKEYAYRLSNTRIIENNYQRSIPCPSSSSLHFFYKKLLLTYKSKERALELLQSYVRSNMELNPISPTIREKLGFLNLTRWGQMKCMAFPDEVLLYAADMFTTCGDKVENAFNWFIKVCLDRCQYLNIQPAWWRSESLAVQYNQPVNPRMVLDKASLLTRDTTSQDGLYSREKPSLTLKRYFPDSDIKPASSDALVAFVSPSSMTHTEQIAVKRATQAPAFKEKFTRFHKGGRGEWQSYPAKVLPSLDEMITLAQNRLQEPTLTRFAQELIQQELEILLLRKKKEDTPQPPSMKRPQKHAELKSLGQMAINVLDQYNLPP